MLKHIMRIGLVVLVAGVFALPLVLAQIGDRELDIAIGKAETAKAQLKQAYGKHFDEEDFQGALAAYQDVVERFPQSPEAAEAQFRRANIYHWDLIEPQKAIEEYQKVIDSHPDTDYAIEAMIRMGEAYARMRDYDTAVVTLRTVVESYPASDYLPQAKATLAGLLLHDLHQDDEARAIFRTILADHAHTEFADSAKLWLTYIAQKQGSVSTEEALRTYRSLADDLDLEYHTRASAQYMVGFASYLVGDLGSAKAEFDRVLSSYPEAHEDLKAETYYFLGHIQEERGEASLSRDLFALGLDLYPHSLWADSLRGRLEASLR